MPVRHCLLLLALCIGGGACRDGRRDAAARSAGFVPAHIRQAREGLDRLTRGFVPVLEGLAPSLSVPMSQHNADNVRFALLGMGTQHTDAGSLTFYPTGFVVAVGTDGVAVARNIAQADDLMRGMPLATMFPVIRSALGGTSGTGVGELAATADQPSRGYLVAAVPVHDAQGAVVGALASGISFGQISRALDTAIRMNAGQEPVLWVGLRHNGRVFPSGRDRDVPERWLVPASLVTQIPPGADQQVESGRGEYVWQFVENGARGWAGGLGRLVQIQETDVLIFRSEASQN